jgi:beta-1,4-mannosyltransferase
MTATQAASAIVEKRIIIPDLGPLRRLSLLHAIVKGLYILFSIMWTLVRLPSYEMVLIQNPPALPALVATLLVEAFSLFYRTPAHIVIDWHNLGFTMFEEKEGKRATVAKLSKALERYFTSWAHEHFCVSKAMQDWLKEEFAVGACVLYDRPDASFSTEPLPAAQRHALLLRLGFTHEALFGSNNSSNGGGGNGNAFEASYSVSTIHTTQAFVASAEYGAVGGTPRMLLDNRSAGTATDAGGTGGLTHVPIVISSTSWTPDEDFGILLDGLVDLNEKLASSSRSSSSTGRKFGDDGDDMKILVVVTGKGPTKQAFLDKVSSSPLSHIAIKTVWLEPEDYPLLMRCADVGVCLHTSTSGLDLPMKVLDMFGSGMPVVAVSFPTLPELVQHGKNGYIFDADKPTELSSRIFQLLAHGKKQAFPPRELVDMRKRAGELSGWHPNWLMSVGEPVETALLSSQKRTPLLVMAGRLLIQTVTISLVWGGYALVRNLANVTGNAASM